MNVLITGAGLLGAHTAADLIDAGHEPLLVDVRPDSAYVEQVAGDVPIHLLDAVDADRLAALARRADVDAVVHTAALIGPKANRDPYLAVRVNVGATLAAAEAARRTRAKRLVLASSLAVYDWSEPSEPPREDAAPRPRSVYGATKAAAEMVALAYAAGGAVAATILRFAGLYGYGRFRGGSVFGALLQRTIEALLERGRADLDPRLANREYLYVRDAARAVRMAVERPDVAGLLNVGSGRVERADDLAHALRCAVPGAEVSVPLVDAPPVPPLALEKATERLGYAPAWPLADGLADLAAAVRLGTPTAGGVR